MKLNQFLFAFAIFGCSINYCICKGKFRTYNLEGRKAFQDSLRYQNEIESNWNLEEEQQDSQKSADNSIRVEKYTPDWESLDKRPLPQWYDEAKIGIFIHWGVFSVVGISDAWFWNHWKTGNKQCEDYMKEHYKPSFTYQDFAPQFTAQFFNSTDWAKLFQNSGAKYVVLTSKHHDGYALWPTKFGFGWNAMDVGPRRDLVGELASSIRENTNLHFGLYHSLYEWYNPLYMEDHMNNYTTNQFVKFKTMPELYELVETYKPEVVWSDGDWEAPESYWKSKEFLAWLYNSSPVKDSVVTNDRWGQGVSCKHGGFYSCADRFNPGVLQPHKWENCMTLDKWSWGIRKQAPVSDYLTPEQLMSTIIESVSCGGNILINVGPTEDGMIIPIQQERLMQMGEWLGVNGEAIYKSIPWRVQNDTFTSTVWYTSSSDKTKVYGMMTKWPGSEVTLGAVSPQELVNVTILGYKAGMLEWSNQPWQGEDDGIRIKMPPLEKINSKWAWTLVFSLK